MNRALALSLPDDRLSRREVVSRIAGAGAATIFAATLPGRPRPAALAAQPALSFQTNQPKGNVMSQATPTPSETTPTIVLVHGAFADSSSWNGVIPDLLSRGYPVVAAANPLRSLSGDTEYVASVLAAIDGPIVLVGHSYGGMVITNAATGNDNVKALVYVAAFAPDAGENALGLSQQFPGSTLGDALVPNVLPDGATDLSIRTDVFHDQFAADVPESTTVLMCATQRPVTDVALSEASGEPAWKTIPSWYIYGEEDRNIPAALQAFLAERAGSKEAVAIPGGSHVVMISNPEAVTRMIQAAIDATVAVAV